MGALNVTFSKDISNNLNGLDMSKAYPSVLKDIKNLPVFQYFDTYQKYDNHEIEDLTIYIIYSNDIYARHLYSRQYGFMVKLLVNYTLLHFRRPSKIIKCDFSTVLSEIFESDIPMQMKKDISNITIGKLRRNQQSKSITHIFKDEEEALANFSIYGENARMEKISDGDFFIYVVNITTSCNLQSGFRNFNELIVSLCSAKAINNINLLKLNGIEVLGLKTDCIMYKSDEGWGLEENKYVENNFKMGKLLGEYNMEKNKTTDKLTYYINENSLFEIIDLGASTKKIFTKEEEWEVDCKTILNECVNYESVLVLGWRAGVGKSSICKKFARGKILFVCPTNALCDDLRYQGFDAITIHSLFGWNQNDEALKSSKFDISNYGTIVFDEILQTSESIRLQIIRFMENNIDKFYIANGDARQLISSKDKNLQQEMMVTEDEIDDYRVHCLNVMFPSQIYLKNIKRGDTQEDNDELERISDDILALKKNPDRSLLFKLLEQKWKIPVIYKMCDVETKKNLTYYRNTRKTINNHWAKKNGRNELLFSDQVREGDIIVGSKYHKFTKFKICGIKYIVYQIKKDAIIIMNLNEKTTYDENKDEKKVLPLAMEIPNNIFNAKMMFNYASTIDGCQGVTIGGEKVCLWDIQSPFINYRYVYVMVTRVRSLKQLILFKYSQEKVDMLHKTYGKLLIENRIDGHKEADFEAGRIQEGYEEKDYVDYEWVLNQLDKQEDKSELSGEFITIESCSIDRIDNSIGHFKNNCRLLTWLENVSKSDN